MMGVRHPIERFTTSSVTYDEQSPFFTNGLRGGSLKQKPNDAVFVPPVIEDDVWIGEGVLIGTGVTFGTGCIVAARSIVTKSIPPYHVVAGAPAKTVRLRFAEKTVEALLSSCWTHYDVKNIPLEADAPIDKFIEEFALATSNKTVELIDIPELFYKVIAAQEITR